MRAHQNPLKAAWDSLFNRIIGKNLVFILIEPLGRVHLSFFCLCAIPKANWPMVKSLANKISRLLEFVGQTPGIIKSKLGQ